MSIVETALTSFIDRKLAQPHSVRALPGAQQQSLVKGILAGAIAGLAATAARSLVEKIYPPRANSATPVQHWLLGACTGAAYGGLAEFFPAATSRDGANFGMTLMALTHEPNAAAGGKFIRSETSQMASHVVFGIVAETARRTIRQAL
jgi:putative membrane protein